MPISTINNKSIADGTVIAADILDGTISSSKLVSANIAGDRIAANTLSNTVFQTGSVESYLRGANLDFGMRNRIINGAMVIDQRNGGAAVNPTDGQYSVDRWQCRLTQSAKYSAQQDSSSNTVAGFASSLKVTSLSSYSVGASDNFQLQYRIEGYNFADMRWGTANARPVTLSFWVRSSLTGTFGGAVTNADGNRSYPFTYTINSANTWEYETITIPGDTSGTWNTTNGRGLELNIGLGVGSTYSGTAGSWSSNFFISATGATSVVGTNGATFYITGVQLEEGSVPTPFEYRQYTTELALCQRYFQTWFKGTGTGSLPYWGTTGGGTSGVEGPFVFLQQMRTTPTYSINALELYDGGASTYAVTAITNYGSSNQCPRLGFSATGLTTNRMYYVLPININAYFFASAEL
jgi:hypothetical protein